MWEGRVRVKGLKTKFPETVGAAISLPDGVMSFLPIDIISTLFTKNFHLVWKKHLWVK